MNSEIIFDGITYGINGNFYYEYRRAGKYYSKPIYRVFGYDGNPVYFCKIANGKTHYLTEEEVEKFNSLVQAVGAKI